MKFSGHCFYIRKRIQTCTNVLGDFKICISVPLRNGKVFTDVFLNPTDHHQYLHYLSVHPYYF